MDENVLHLSTASSHYRAFVRLLAHILCHSCMTCHIMQQILVPETELAQLYLHTLRLPRTYILISLFYAIIIKLIFLLLTDTFTHFFGVISWAGTP